MELPKTVNPSPLSPHYIKSYVWPPLLAVGIAVGVVAAAPALRFLPFSPYYLLVLALLPLLRLGQVEMERRSHEYEFHSDRVVIREGIETVEAEDVLYEKVTDVHSVTPPYEESVDVGDLDISVAGRDKTFSIIGIKHPDRYEDLIMGRGGRDAVEEVRAELEQLEERYEDGDIGRAEYEQRYYYLQGKLDALEGA